MIRFISVLCFACLFLLGSLGQLLSQNQSEEEYEQLAQANDLFNRGVPYLNQDQPDSATYCFATSLDLYHKVKYRDGVLTSGIYLAIALKNQGRLTELLDQEHALESYLNEADSLFTQIKLSLGAAHFARGNYLASLRYLLKSQHSFEDQNSSNFALLLQIHRNQAQVYRKLDHPRMELGFYQKILKLVKTNKVFIPDQALITLLIQSGHAYAKTYQPEQAQKQVQEALQLIDKIDLAQARAAEVYTQLGEIAELVGDYDQASAFFRKVIQPLKNSDENYAPILFRLAKLAFLDKRYENARDSLNLVSPLFEADKNRYTDKLAETYFLLGETRRISITKQQIEPSPADILEANQEALEYYQKVFGVWDKEYEEKSIYKIPSLKTLPQTKLAHDLLWAYAQALQDQYPLTKKDLAKRMKSSLSTYQKAMELGDLIRKNNRVEEIELIPLERLGKTYEEAIQVALDIFDKEEEDRYLGIAFQFQQRKKSAETRELFWDYFRKNGYAWSLGEQTERRDFIVKLEESERNQALAKDDDHREAIELHRTGIEGKFESFMNSFRYAHPSYFSLKYKKDYTDILALRAYLQEGEIMVSFFQGDRFIYIFSLSKDNIQVELVNKSKLQKDLEGFLEQVASPNTLFENYTNRAYLLYKELLAPSLPDTLNSLIIVPDGILHHLPIEALISDVPEEEGFSKLDYLIKKYPIRYLTHSADLLPSSYSSPSRGEQNRYAAFMPSYYEEDLSEWMDSLRMNADEQKTFTLPEAAFLADQEESLKKRVNLMKGDSFTGKKMTKHKFGRYAARYYSIDIAGFAFSTDYHPVYSGLTFANQVEGENFLAAYEIAQNLYTNDLVTLPNHSSLGKKNHGYGLRSLLGSFRLANSQNIALSLWQVNGNSNQHLLDEFYKNLYSGFGKAQSLRDAKLEYLADADASHHPYHWASMVLYGDNIELKGEERPWWSYGALFFALFMILVIIFGFRRKRRKR